MQLLEPDDFPWYHKLWMIPLAYIILAYQEVQARLKKK